MNPSKLLNGSLLAAKPTKAADAGESGGVWLPGVGGSCLLVTETGRKSEQIRTKAAPGRSVAFDSARSAARFLFSVQRAALT
jgi:hypothetical protein